MPVLTKKAIKCAGLVENRQVIVTILRARGVGKGREACLGASRTDPISHTIGWQGVVVPAQVAILRAAAGYLARQVSSQAAIASALGCYPALVQAKMT